jgi:hypothetical protein
MARSIVSSVWPVYCAYQLVHPVPDAQDFLGLDLDVGRHALRAARRLVDHDPGVGERDAHARLAGASRKLPIEAAWPMQTVPTRGRIYCIVSWIAMPAVTTPPGELMYMKMSFFGFSTPGRGAAP